jgi:hypothetical protein
VVVHAAILAVSAHRHGQNSSPSSKMRSAPRRRNTSTS